jgi:xanthine dehydrogenase accessory factor
MSKKNSSINIISQIIELLAFSEIFCLATVIASVDNDITPGNKTIVLQDGTVKGGTGKTEVDELIRNHALKTINKRKKQTVEIKNGIRIFFDVISENNKLVICGAGHIAIPLARFTRELGFSVTVIDDRPDFANQSRFEGCQVIAEDFLVALRQTPLNHSTYVVIITRGHEHDADCLSEVLSRKTAYVGLIGSRRRVHFVLELMSRNGIPADRLEEVFTPIGIPIGAESPEEIALSIAAELVCVRRKGSTHAKVLNTFIKEKL